MIMLSDISEMDIDLSEFRGLVWATKCAEALNTEVNLKVLRGFVRNFKRTGNFDELFDNLSNAVDI